MHCNCPICSNPVIQSWQLEKVTFCPNCQSLFVMPTQKMPPWILGVLVILTATWQVMVFTGHPLL